MGCVNFSQKFVYSLKQEPSGSLLVRAGNCKIGVVAALKNWDLRV
jgi:hypothetical protein